MKRISGRSVKTRGIGLLAVCGLLMGAGGQNPAAQEFAKFEGVWRFALVEVEGVKQSAMPYPNNMLIVTKDGRYVIAQGARITHGVIKLDPAKTPKHYDVTLTNSPGKGQSFQGIYEIDGDTYKICMALPGRVRPTDFVSKAGNGRLLHIFKRVKHDVREALTAVGRQELTGKWEAVSYVLNGEKASYEDLKAVTLAIDDDGKFTVRNAGAVLLAGTTTLDPSQSPLVMDMTITEGTAKGQTSLGIYKIEDDVVTICRASPGQARPTEFASKPGSGLALMSYKREKTPAK